MERGRRKQLIERYRDGYRVVSEAVRGMTDAELDRKPADGSWSARRVVHHLADSEMTSAIRLRRLVAEERPAIQGYDEMAFAERLYYDGRPIAASLEALKAARATSVEVLERLTEAEWAREGIHSESGPYSVETWLEIYASHAHDHAEQIRQALGKD